MHPGFMATASMSARWHMGAVAWLPLINFTRRMGTASAAVTDQIIQYALSQCKVSNAIYAIFDLIFTSCIDQSGNHDQGIDVLNSGLSMQDEQSLRASRLYLAQGTVEVDRGKLPDAIKYAEQAAYASRPDTSKKNQSPAENMAAYIAARRLAVTSWLTQGEDVRAEDACGGLLEALSNNPDLYGPDLHADALSLTVTVQHALGTKCLVNELTDPTATVKQLQEALDKPTREVAGQPEVPARSRTLGLLALADWHASSPNQGVSQRAAEYYNEATETAKKLEAQLQGQLLFPTLLGELHSAALLGQAQLAVSDSRWDEAEEILGKALTAAEGVSSDKHVRTLPALMLLGYVYSRSARVTFAEGLFRECAKVLHVDPVINPMAESALTARQWPVHPSMLAYLSWRFHQLLAALPNRGRESSAWQSLATLAWQSGGRGLNPDIAEVLGSSDLLTGKGSQGSGVWLHTMTRRLLPMLPPQQQ